LRKRQEEKAGRGKDCVRREGGGMAYQARVLYDFEAASPGELPVKEGDLVTVTLPDVGQGWSQAKDSSGQEGVVPEAYLERAGAPSAGASPPAVAPSLSQASSFGWDDDKWDSDEEEHRYEDPADLQPPAPKGPGIDYGPVKGVQTSKDPVVRPPRPAGKPTYSFSLGKNMMPGWGKSGAVTDFLTGVTESAATLSSQAVMVAEGGEGGFQWQGKLEPFTCTIGQAKKTAKFGGMKPFVLYPVTPSFSNIQVSRRYKHFDWLHERLVAKFGSVIAIPPLPDKQATGRFDEELIEHRRIQLQSFTDRICRHPILAGSEVWMHFVSETDDKKWTQGKRKAESDPLVGTAFLTTVQAPSILAETEATIDGQIAGFGKEVNKMEVAVRALHAAAGEQAEKCRGETKKDMVNVGRAFKQLGLATGGRVTCLDRIGATYEELGTDWENQATRDWEPLKHSMHDYKGLTEAWAGMLDTHNTVRDKGKEIQHMGGEKERDAAVARVNTYRVGVAAELGFFHQEVDADFNYGCQSFVAEQIRFHRQMADRLDALYR